MYNYNFPSDYESIKRRLERVDPVKYGQTRNFVFGKVSYLSPYISRGVLPLDFIKTFILSKFTKEEAYPFIYELAWREYYQRIYYILNEEVCKDVRHEQIDVKHYEIPLAVVNHNTKIITIDEQIKTLYKTGYMHNHTRMYIASIVCNIGKAHWLQPARWMYYHCLDGDIGSGYLSWQWICGTFSNKKYVANQDNLNFYTNSNQKETFLDKCYDELMVLRQPEILSRTILPVLKTNLAPYEIKNTELKLDYNLPLLIYNSYNLDPNWHKHIRANRLLLLEPDHFNKYPVSDNVLNFIVALSNNINGIQIFTGNFKDIPGIEQFNEVIFKEHPTARHYSGVAERQKWLFPEVLPKFYNTFSGFWNICEKFYYGQTNGLYVQRHN